MIHSLRDEVSSDGVDLVLRLDGSALDDPGDRVPGYVLPLHLRVGLHLLHDVTYQSSVPINKSKEYDRSPQLRNRANWIVYFNNGLGLTMLISKLNGSVDPPAFLGDVELDVQLLLHHVITRNIFSNPCRLQNNRETLLNLY